MLDKTSRSHAQVGMLGSNNGHKKDAGSRSKSESARRRKVKLVRAFQEWAKMDEKAVQERAKRNKKFIQRLTALMES
jgi:hypothetical protein